LDRARWTGLWHRLGARGDGLPVFSRLAAAYAESTRAYHTAEHIEDCLTQLDSSGVPAQHPDEVEAAIWFHDAVYVATRADNEERSAELARDSLREAGVASTVTARIGRLVLATRHDVAPSDPDAALLCDIDLSILGRSPDVFGAFERRIRQEYAWVPEATYRSTRARILRELLRRPQIYQTDRFRQRYEVQARANLERLVRDLGG
jgi:predicted metal-dependent HD superfamily phosphohydrolase